MLVHAFDLRIVYIKPVGTLNWSAGLVELYFPATEILQAEY